MRGSNLMLDIGWSELLIIAAVAILVVGPKDLPRMLNSLGRMMGKLRGMANEFRTQFDQAMQDTEMQELRSEVEDLGNINPLEDIKKSFESDFDIDFDNDKKREDEFDDEFSSDDDEKEVDDVREDHSLESEEVDVELVSDAESAPAVTTNRNEKSGA